MRQLKFKNLPCAALIHARHLHLMAHDGGPFSSPASAPTPRSFHKLLSSFRFSPGTVYAGITSMNPNPNHRPPSTGRFPYFSPTCFLR